jgi:hypothetical protein
LLLHFQDLKTNIKKIESRVGFYPGWLLK